MDLNGLSLFQQMEQKMHWLAARQTVLSQNIANADTPDYKAKDLKPFSFQKHMELASALPMVATSAGHITGGAGVSTKPVVTQDGEAVETSPDGNKVSIEEQMTKVADTGMEYQALTNLYRKQLSMLKTALGHSGTSA